MPVVAECPEAEFVELLQTIGPAKTADHIKRTIRSVYSRRERIEKRTGKQIRVPEMERGTRVATDHPGRIHRDVIDGVVLVGSDAHYWPEEVLENAGAEPISTAHRALVHFARKLKPAGIVMNGDGFDGSKISRFAPIGWEKRPQVVDELEACGRRLAEIVRVSPDAWHDWPLGNHDSRFETRLATVAPEYARVKGVHLRDHFPDWTPCWSVWINDDVVVKHRFRGGVHATWNNTLHAGKTIVTGHLHSQMIRPFTDYNGTRWGVDSGCIAEPAGPQFRDYTEDNPLNWRSGFAVLTFKGGELLDPEVVRVIGRGEVVFRGQVTEV